MNLSVTAVIEPNENGVLLRLPDGREVVKGGPGSALAALRKWSAENPEVVISVEWRGGLGPPGGGL